MAKLVKQGEMPFEKFYNKSFLTRTRQNLQKCNKQKITKCHFKFKRNIPHISKKILIFIEDVIS